MGRHSDSSGSRDRDRHKKHKHKHKRRRSYSSSSSSEPRERRRKRNRKSAWDLGGEQATAGAAAAASSGDPQAAMQFQQLQQLMQQAQQAQVVQAQTQLLASQATAAQKKQRELFVGNLAVGQVNEAMLKQFFTGLFNKLPQYAEKFPGSPCPVVSVRTNSDGKFAFVEFIDECISTTALKFDKTDLCGRPVNIGRPKEYQSPPGGDPTPLDVSPLQNAGVITGTERLPPSQKIRREIYVGNLPEGATTDMVKEMFMPDLANYLQEDSHPVVRVNMPPNSRFAFVEMRSEAAANAAISMFHRGATVMGKTVRVARPTNYKDQTGEDPPPIVPIPRGGGGGGGRGGGHGGGGFGPPGGFGGGFGGGGGYGGYGAPFGGYNEFGGGGSPGGYGGYGGYGGPPAGFPPTGFPGFPPGPPPGAFPGAPGGFPPVPPPGLNEWGAAAMQPPGAGAGAAGESSPEGQDTSAGGAGDSAPGLPPPFGGDAPGVPKTDFGDQPSY
eukprot:TRINITY_DN56059_c0_g1_i1.p1 TRINITY_DN56059_c0_g1~~TRINITY_DN56059_c0_g1_i1.p1  ORF type:complete len:505 (-),score=81.27 TRINITY_DN56059_c0_g1_i1:311-1801(-)